MAKSIFSIRNRTPPVDIYLSKISAIATNLSNTRDLKNELPAGVKAQATTLGGGGLSFQLQFNPMSDAPTYQLDTALTNVDAAALNSFLMAYGKFDIQHGVFSLFTSVAAKDSNYEGYFKVFFHDLKVFSWKKGEGQQECAGNILAGRGRHGGHDLEKSAQRTPWQHACPFPVPTVATKSASGAPLN